MELAPRIDVSAAVFGKMREGSAMFYVYELQREKQGEPISLDRMPVDDFVDAKAASADQTYDAEDVDFVDDSLLNTAPHNKIEQQLLRGDVVGLALMSGAILWSAMGAFG